MSFYWVKTHWAVKKIFKSFVWDIAGNEKKVYLTFDDGPTPDVTEWVLGVLQKHNIKATFFCIGNNIENHPEIFKKVVLAGHSVGNHTYNHVNGWNTDTPTYLSNADKAEQSITSRFPKFTENKLFRPPYGRIKKAQAKALLGKGYKIIMWDVLSADFDPFISTEKCLTNVIRNTRAGSVIIFHDSLKASKNLKYALPKVIEHLKAEGFVFDAI